ncbi:MAG: hypothetical protein H7301_00870 [Cryobacterium sp.]|nr:hypothetical protein [Oligoflexia bacterium]
MTKKFILVLALLSLLSLPQANASSSPEDACVASAQTLKQVMKDMNVIWKQLEPQIADPAANPDSVAKSIQLQQLTTEALSLCVRKLEKVTDPAAKELEYLEYQKMVRHLFTLEGDLAKALLANDSASAKLTMDAMKELQKIGHKRFK